MHFLAICDYLSEPSAFMKNEFILLVEAAASPWDPTLSWWWEQVQPQGCACCSSPVSARAHRVLQSNSAPAKVKPLVHAANHNANSWKPHIHQASISVSGQSWSHQAKQQESWIKPAVFCLESYPQTPSFLISQHLAWTCVSSTQPYFLFFFSGGSALPV